MADINPWVAGGLGAGAGILANNYLNSNYKNPANAAMPYLNQVQGTLQQYSQPYVNAGNQALDQLPGIYGSMLDPNSLMQKIGSGYQASPGYQWQLGQGTQAINNAASSGGMIGTPQHQQQEATMAEGLANQDYYNYLGKALGLYGAGAEGEQGLANMGQQASQGLGENLAQSEMNQGNLAYAGAANQNQTQQGTTGGILAFLGQLLGGSGSGNSGGSGFINDLSKFLPAMM